MDIRNMANKDYRLIFNVGEKKATEMRKEDRAYFKVDFITPRHLMQRYGLIESDFEVLTCTKKTA
jgi:hypothetical protein